MVQQAVQHARCHQFESLSNMCLRKCRKPVNHRQTLDYMQREERGRTTQGEGNEST